MLERLGFFFADRVARWMPDSFVFAILLTAIAAVLSLLLTPTQPVDLIIYWSEGFWSMLDFTMQMVIVIMLGYSIGISPLVRKLFDRLAKQISSPITAYLLISLLSLTLSLINWGLGPVVAVFAAEVCRRVKGIDFRLACAAVYTGLIPWHGGLSASAPLMMNTMDNAFIQMGLVEETIPTSVTLGSTLNLVLIAASFVLIPSIILLLAPRRAEEKYDAAQLRTSADSLPEGELVATIETNSGVSSSTISPADRLNTSRLLPLIVIVPGVFYIFHYFSRMGFDGLELNSFNFTFLILALLVHGSPIQFMKAVKESVKGLGPMIIQFPFYAGILGIVMYSDLSGVIADSLIRLSTATTLSWFSFVTAAIVNLFIPSGGGEWMVIGPTLINAAAELGTPIEKIIISFGYGDALTNLINPFWTLSFLAIMARVMPIRARDFMGYAVLVALVFFVVISAAVLLIP